MMDEKCLWGIVPRDDFSRMIIIAELGDFYGVEKIKVDSIEEDGRTSKILIIEEELVNHLIKMRSEEVGFDSYIKMGDSKWQRANSGGDIDG